MSRLDKVKQDAQKQVKDLPNDFLPCSGESKIHENFCPISPNCIESCTVVDVPDVIGSLDTGSTLVS